MKAFNRFIVFSKRIFSKKLYIALLVAILFLTVAYLFLPEKKQSADIKVAVLCLDDSRFTPLFYQSLEDNSVYTFYIAKNEEQMIRDVKSGKTECGFVIPENFFADYIAGNASDNPVKQYVIPSTTLAESISETVFSNIYEICAAEILYTGAKIPEYNAELGERLSVYMAGDEIFRIKDNSNGKYLYSNMSYRLSLPVFEISLILLLLSGMLGLLTHMEDRERDIYLALGKGEQFSIMSTSILAALLPVFCVGFLSIFLTYQSAGKLLFLAGFLVGTFLICLILGLIIKKSSLFVKLLPLITFLTTILVFFGTMF